MSVNPNDITWAREWMEKRQDCRATSADWEELAQLRSKARLMDFTIGALEAVRGDLPGGLQGKIDHILATYEGFYQ